MNEEEKQAVEKMQYALDLINKNGEYTSDEKDIKHIIVITNLIIKQQKEIKARLEEIDGLYKMISTKDDEIEYLADDIEQMREDYQILKDDIEGHRIAYVDTPEFEEKYISKDKIREIREKYKKERANMTQIIFSQYGKTQRTFKQAVVNEVIKVLDEILGE